MQALQLFVITVILYHDIMAGGTGELKTDGVSTEFEIRPLGKNGYVKYRKVPVPLDSSVGNSEVEADLWTLFSENAKNIYTHTLSLLTLKMQTLLDNGNFRLDDIKEYLGFSKPTIRVLNEAMSELLDDQRLLERRNSKHMDHLSDIYYFSCAVEDIRDRVREDTMVLTVVKEKFESFIENVDYSSMIVRNKNEKHLVTALKSFFNEIPKDKKVKPEFRVTIPLMKNWTFFKDTRKNAVKQLADTVVDPTKENTLGYLAAKYSEDAIATKVNQNHLNILRIVIPRLFLFAYDYVKLVLMLKDFELNKKEKTFVKTFSTFTERFTQLFVERYFEFSGEPRDEKLLDNLEALSEFCNPESTNKIIRALPNILNYGIYKSKTDEKHTPENYDKYVDELLKNTLTSLVESFGNEKVLMDSITSKTYNIKKTKEEYLELITNTINDGLDVLNEFEKYTNYN